MSATICAAGLDAQVAYGIPKFRRIPLCGGEVSYLLSIVEQLCGHIGRRVTFTIDDEELTVDCLMCAICNGRAYGGGFLAAPEADPADGWLDVMIVRRVGRLTIAKLLGMYKSGRHFVNGQLTEEAKPYFLYRRARRVALCPADVKVISIMFSLVMGSRLLLIWTFMVEPSMATGVWAVVVVVSLAAICW